MIQDELVECYAKDENGQWTFQGREKKQFCIHHDGQWKKHVDFVMDVLGAGKVTALYREWLTENKITMSGIDRTEYLVFLRSLVELALADLQSGSVTQQTDSW